MLLGLWSLWSIHSRTAPPVVPPVVLCVPPTVVIDPEKICETTGWDNNCGLNCLAHFFCDKLQDGTLEKEMSDNLEYQLLLKIFQNYYQLEQTPTFEILSRLMEQYPVPTDREGIWGPVFREYLIHLMSRADCDLSHWESSPLTAFGMFLENNPDVGDNFGPIINSNLQEFTGFKNRYLNKDAKLFASLCKEAEEYWNKSGRKKYANYIRDNEEKISKEMLQYLGGKLDIGISVFYHGQNQIPSKETYKWRFQVLIDKTHWKYMAATQVNAKTHNGDFYSIPEAPRTFDERTLTMSFSEEETKFFKDDTRSGYFKLYGAEPSVQKSRDDITAHVHYTLATLQPAAKRRKVAR